MAHFSVLHVRVDDEIKARASEALAATHSELFEERAMGVEFFPDFTPAARQHWESIPAPIRQRLLANIWCAQCHGDAARVIEAT